MRFEPRQYQEDCVNAWVQSFLDSHLNSPLVAVPTGAGKTVIVCEFLSRWFELYPDENVLILSHTEEIIQQDHDALLEYFPAFGVGIYAAALGRKEVRKVTVGMIHSCYRVPAKFKDFGLVIVDEAHAINHEDKGMYRTLFKFMNCRVGGMSATIFRTGHGYIHKGKGTLFNTVAYDLTSVGNFNKLVEDGYLTKLVSKATDFELDSSKVGKTGGDYNLKQLSKEHDRDSITNQACDELVKYGKNYKKWLVFAIDIKHADHITYALNNRGVEADVLHTKIKRDRSTVLNDFKYGPTRAVVSVGMVTTGFDAPNVDLIALLRPTLSPVLHVQMVGRGLRVAPSKSHCLVLDFAGNTERLGPINNPIIIEKYDKKKSEIVGQNKRTKVCKRCKVINSARALVCENCKLPFPTNLKLGLNPNSPDIVQESEEDGTWIPVSSVHYTIHNKKGKPDSLCVHYLCGTQVFKEWVCLNHGGFAGAKAKKWVQRRDPTCTIFETHHVYHRRKHINKPTHIQVDGGRFVTVTKYKFKD